MIAVSNPRLLVVDDNPDDRDLMQRRLGKLDYDVAVAVDGRQALAMVARDSFDLVLLDVTMPGINGLDVLRHLRRTHSAAILPVIMLTGLNHLEIQMKAVRLGANDHITKPVMIEVAQARIEKQLCFRQEAVDAAAAREELAKAESGPLTLVA